MSNIKKFFWQIYRYFHAFEKFALAAPIENTVRRPKKIKKNNRYAANKSKKTDKIILHHFRACEIHVVQFVRVAANINQRNKSIIG